MWHNIAFNLHEEIQEGEQKTVALQGLLDIQWKSNQQLCLHFNEACQDMVAALRVAHQEKRKREAMRKELDKLKGEFVKLKGMVHLTVASLNQQNNGVPTKDVQDFSSSLISEESLSDEEVLQENVVTIPVPCPSLEILHTLQEIPPSPSPSLQAFLAQPVVIALFIPLLGSSPQLLCLLVEDSTMGVRATVEEFKGAVEREAELDAMVESLVESEEEPLTNNPDAVEELLEAWNTVVDTSPVEGDFVDQYDGGGFV